MSTTPTLTITGSGGKNTATNTITFNFSEAIKNGSFTVDDIRISNGTINTGSFTKISDTQYTIVVTPNLGGNHSNVAITVLANTFVDIAGNTNTTTTKNTTKISNLKDQVDIDGNDIDAVLTSWNVSHVSDASKAFYNARSFNQYIGDWNVSNVTDMSGMFDYTYTFNQDISDWDVGNVTDMSTMFRSTYAFNQDIGDWNVSKVTDMSWMFHGAVAFNQDIGRWNVGKVTNMSSMFSYIDTFNQDIGRWNVSNVTNMSSMFDESNAFNQDIGRWNVGKVTNMYWMFGSADAFDQNIGRWNVGKVTNMSWMFNDASSFNQDISNWNVSKVTNMRGMFHSADVFNQDIGSWNTSKVTDMSLMFYEAGAFNQDIGSWNISSLTNAIDMFYNNTMMSTANMDNTLRGWAKLDTAAGETSIQSNVVWNIGIINYTDITAKQYLIDTYGWNIRGGAFDGSKTMLGSNYADTLNTSTTKTTIHGLGGNDTLTGGATDDILIGGAGDDTLTGAGGRDIFDYGFKNAGNDIINDFTAGNIKTNANADIIDLRDLLVGYSATSNFSDFVTAAAEGTGTKLTIDHDGTGVSGNSVTITLENIAYTSTLLAELITNGNLALSPTSIVSNITTTSALTINNNNLITEFTNHRVVVNGNDFTCINLTADSGWGNAGSFSNQGFKGNGALTFTAAAGTSSQGVVIGLSNSNVGLDRDDSGYKNIAYAIYLDADGTLDIYEQGNEKVSNFNGGFAENDIFKIERIGTEVEYYKNNMLIYTSTVVSTEALNFDSAFSAEGQKINNVQLFGVDGTAPVTQMNSAKVLESAIISVKSSEVGTAYLIKEGENISTLDKLEMAVRKNTGAKVTINIANTTQNLDTSGLVEGAYKLYAIDAAGNISIAANITTSTNGIVNTTQIINVTTGNTLNGTSSETLIGGAGDDTINGGTGHDTIYGGTGNDIINSGTGGNTIIYGGAGNDNINGGDSYNIIYGDAGDDIINGGTGGNAIIYGGAGADTLTGGLGLGSSNDVFLYGAVTDSTIASGGDTITNFHFIGSTVDRLNLKDVMDFNTSDIATNLAKYIHAEADGDNNVKLYIKHDGLESGTVGSSTADMLINLTVTNAANANALAALLNDNNLNEYYF
jgi:surface protein